jgi:hypothetical protein
VYRLPVFLHILSGIVWLGGAMFSEVLVAGPVDEGKRRMSRHTHVSPRLGPVSIRWQPSSSCSPVPRQCHRNSPLEVGVRPHRIDIAMGLVVVAFTLGIAYFSPSRKRIRQAVQDGSDVSTIVQAIRPVHRIQRIDLLVRLVILALLVYKPH